MELSWVAALIFPSSYAFVILLLCSPKKASHMHWERGSIPGFLLRGVSSSVPTTSYCWFCPFVLSKHTACMAFMHNLNSIYMHIVYTYNNAHLLEWRQCSVLEKISCNKGENSTKIKKCDILVWNSEDETFKSIPILYLSLVFCTGFPSAVASGILRPIRSGAPPLPLPIGQIPLTTPLHHATSESTFPILFHLPVGSFLGHWGLNGDVLQSQTRFTESLFWLPLCQERQFQSLCPST